MYFADHEDYHHCELKSQEGGLEGWPGCRCYGIPEWLSELICTVASAITHIRSKTTLSARQNRTNFM